MKKWEYMVIIDERNFNALDFGPSIDRFKGVLNTYGNDGWELTSAIPTKLVRNPSAHCRELQGAILSFKRQIEE
jgi:hypothetical protein